MIAFEGAVECRRSDGPVTLTLSGREPTVQLLLAGAEVPDTLPARLHDVRVSAVSGAAESELQHLLLRARELQQALSCRSVQLHRDVAAPFFAAVPPAPVPLRARLGWSLLLQVLRLPGAAALLSRLRGHG